MALQNRSALLLLTAVGVAASGHVPAAEPPRPVAAVSPIPPPLAERTYVYILDGVNPLRLAGVQQLADRLQRAGFLHTRAGGWYSGDVFEREIRATHAADLSARFAVIGYSAGSYKARALANRLVQSGVPVAVVGYIGGDYLRDTSATRVPGAGLVVNLTGDGFLLTGRNLMFHGTAVSGAWNVPLGGTSHYDLPAHPRTFATLYSALAAGGNSHGEQPNRERGTISFAFPKNAQYNRHPTDD